MPHDPSISRARGSWPRWPSASLLVAACGAAASPEPGAAAPPRAAGGPERVAGSEPIGAPSPSAAPSTSAAACGTYRGPAATISYAIWGDATELANQQKIVDAFAATEPDDHGEGHRTPTGTPTGPSSRPSLAGGNAPDVFLMDGPLFPDYQARDQLLDLSPLIARDGFDTSQLADLAVQDFTGADGHQYGLPRDMSTVGLYYNKTDVRRGRHPVPGRHLGLGQAGRGRHEADQDVRRDDDPVGLLHRDDRHGELLVLARLAGRRRHPQPRQEDRGHRLRPGRGGDPVPPGPHLQVQGHGRSPCPAGTGDAFENGQAAMEANGSWLVPTHQAAGIDFGVAPLPKGPAGQATSVNPSGVVVYKGTKSPDAAWEFVKCYTGPEMQAKIADAEGVDAGQQAGPGRAVRDLVRRRQDLRRRPRLRPPQALVQGLQRVQHARSRTSSTPRSSTTRS